MTLSWNGKRFDWVNVSWFAAIHVGALLAPWTFTWTGLASRSASGGSWARSASA